MFQNPGLRQEWWQTVPISKNIFEKEKVSFVVPFPKKERSIREKDQRLGKKEKKREKFRLKKNRIFLYFFFFVCFPKLSSPTSCNESWRTAQSYSFRKKCACFPTYFFGSRYMDGYKLHPKTVGNENKRERVPSCHGKSFPFIIYLMNYIILDVWVFGQWS